MLVAKLTKTSNIPILEAGTYPARCIGIIDTGEQWNEMAGKSRREILFLFELPTELVEIDGEQKPRYMSQTYTMSMNEKAKMRIALETWRGKAFTEEELRGFDLTSVVDKPCMLTVVQKQSKNGKTYANISGIAKLIKGMTIPDAMSTLTVFDLDAPDALEKLETLPEWIQNKIKQSETYKEKIAGATEAQGFMDINPDDLPFA